MKSLIVLLAFILAIFDFEEGCCQRPDHCGTVPYMKMLQQKNPDLAGRLQKNEVATQANLSRTVSVTGSIRTIPVVVHVIWHKPFQNLCDAVVQSQIDVLNEDYARLNADRVNTPEPFASLGEDAQIRFVLANRDPHGQPTSGIIRTYTDSLTFEFGSRMKFDSTGGQNEWDPSRYLNIWVCNLEGSVLGYATLPGTSNPGEDGVVITSKAFGRNSYDPAGKYNLGRTTTHEVGHWLNLLHTWGDDNGACSGTDYVSDTPNQADYTFGCPDFPHKSCGNGPDGDMFMNYMDYTDDRCMNIFTKGQIKRMQFAIDTLRASILASDGYFPDSNMVTSVITGNIMVAPNPFESSFNIRVKLKKVSDLKIDVFDLMGNLLYEKKFVDCFCETYPVDMRTFNRGVYIARIKSNEETVVTKLFLSK